jgi:hypothetical protein
VLWRAVMHLRKLELCCASIYAVLVYTVLCAMLVLLCCVQRYIFWDSNGLALPLAQHMPRTT